MELPEEFKKQLLELIEKNHTTHVDEVKERAIKAMMGDIEKCQGDSIKLLRLLGHTIQNCTDNIVAAMAEVKDLILSAPEASDRDRRYKLIVIGVSDGGKELAGAINARADLLEKGSTQVTADLDKIVNIFKNSTPPVNDLKH